MNEIIIDSFSTQTSQIFRIFADKKKSAVICINLRHLRAYLGERYKTIKH